MKKQHLSKYRLFSAIFDTQQSKDDVIMDLTFTALERFCATILAFHVSLVVIGQQIKEKRRGHNVPPPACMQNSPA